MSWDFQFDVTMGYAAGETNVNTNINSLTDTIITDSLLLGNNGEGTWVFLVSSDSPLNYKLECLKWHWDNKDVVLTNSFEMTQCPCTESNVRNDVNFYYHPMTKCYQQAMEFRSQGKVSIALQTAKVFKICILLSSS
ncbi:uncharacterized protein LOC106883116 [Octopus bimaculoides]|uniref:uncharacterized protein LOC106883116 n=1 Tax=Octopus bimaculoides TaxID=37653 RepID=UPI0022E72AEB|nr:uncharacterized protein LOC106883116 [Octopus bimaculoides]